MALATIGHRNAEREAAISVYLQMLPPSNTTPPETDGGANSTFLQTPPAVLQNVQCEDMLRHLDSTRGWPVPPHYTALLDGVVQVGNISNISNNSSSTNACSRNADKCEAQLTFPLWGSKFQVEVPAHPLAMNYHRHLIGESPLPDLTQSCEQSHA